MTPLRSLCIIIASLAAAGAACGPSIVEPPAMGSSSGATTDVVEPSTGLAATTGTTGTTADPPGTSTAVDEGTSDDSIFLVTPDGGGCVTLGDGTWHCSRCDVGAQDCPRGEKCVPCGARSRSPLRGRARRGVPTLLHGGGARGS